MDVQPEINNSKILRILNRKSQNREIFVKKFLNNLFNPNQKNGFEECSNAKKLKFQIKSVKSSVSQKSFINYRISRKNFHLKTFVVKFLFLYQINRKNWKIGIDGFCQA